ncbi:MAG: hypothetical protein J07HB67_02606 [halophilic archaeon J07HB67]|nr:MAG: hypothetical protein J07HB67_02606 [halophilic archaeon J07HB67]
MSDYSALAPWRRLGPRASLAVVLLTAAVCAGATVVAADTVGTSVTGTTAVGNPDRPPERVCDQRTNETSRFAGACAAPREVDIDRGNYAATAVRQLLPGTLLSVTGVWLLFTGVFALGGAARTVGVRTAWALPPLAVPAVARAVVATRLAPTTAWPTELEPLAATARRVALAGGNDLVTVAGLLGVGASAAVLVAVARDTDGVWWGPLAAGGATVTLATGPLLGVPTPASLGTGMVVTALGLPTTFAPRRVAALAAQRGLLGHSTVEQAEPEPRHVTAHHVVGLLLLAAGLVVAGVPAYLV